MANRFFITGGAGFIASHIIEALIDEHEVVVFDNFNRDALRFTSFKNHSHLSVIKGDILDSKLLEDSMKSCDTVIHCAAVAGIHTVNRDANLTMKTNFIGTHNVLEACIKNGAERVINFSTSEVYGPFIYKAEESGYTTLGEVGKKRWTYAVSKLAAEHFSNTYFDKYQLKVISVRPFNIYGPRQIGEGAIEQFVKHAIENSDINIYNDGMQIRSWCYVKDFVKAILSIIDNKEICSEVFNIGNPKCTITTLGLAELVIELTGSKSKIKHLEYPGPEVELRIPNINKAMDVLNYHPIVSLKDGINETIKWYQSNQ